MKYGAYISNPDFMTATALSLNNGRLSPNMNSSKGRKSVEVLLNGNKTNTIINQKHGNSSRLNNYRPQTNRACARSHTTKK